jgi:anti-sigma factor RsiW
MTCREFQPLLETFVDGELSTEQTLLVENHLEQCGRCAEHAEFLGSLKASVQRAVACEAVVSDNFRDRLRRTVDAEVARELRSHSEAPAHHQGTFTSHLRPLRGRSVASLFALAAGLLLWVGMSHQSTGRDGAPLGAFTQASTSNTTVEQTLNRLIDYHSSPPAPQVTEVGMLPSFEPNVGVHIQLPTFGRYKAQWEGANLVPIKNHQAASLRYKVLGHRVTVYVYDASKVNVDDRLERRLVKNHPIFVGRWRGYNVATRENRGIGYAATADLDASDLEQIMTEIQ